MSAAPIHPIRTQTAGPMKMVGIQGQYSDQTMGEIPQLWHQFGPKIDTIVDKASDFAYGIVWETNAGSAFRYMAAVDQTPAGEIPEGMTSLDIPERTYAVFEHTGSLNHLHETIHSIFSSWRPITGAQLADFPSMLEVYGEEFDPQTSSGHIELWVALA